MRYGVAAAALAIVIIAGSTFLVNSSLLPWSGVQSASGASLLVIQLTDPPQVPHGTSSLNLTFTSLGLLVGEPTGSDHLVSTGTVNVAPSGGSATLDLLKLQNVSQTIGSASIPAGSEIYSVTFTVSGIKIDVNGTVSAVSLATGGSTFTVTLADHPELHGTNLALLQLDPAVVNTASGYKLIPSSVGVLRQSDGQGEDQFGYQHQLNSQDETDLEAAQGSVSASLLAFSVSGDMTMATFQVDNTGGVQVTLNAIGLHGNFEDKHGGQAENHPEEVVFVPVIPASPSTTTTSTSSSTTTSAPKSCSAYQLKLASGGPEEDMRDGLVLNPGDCAKLSFSGIITSGGSNSALIPSVLSGQAYEVHIIASNGANLQLDCVLPVAANSCIAEGSNQLD
jgi:hypothetical protein